MFKAIMNIQGKFISSNCEVSLKIYPNSYQLLQWVSRKGMNQIQFLELVLSFLIKSYERENDEPYIYKIINP